MLIQNGAVTPKAVSLSTTPYSADWSAITASTSAQLTRQIESAGWTLFYMASEIRRNAFGFNSQSRTARATGRLIDAVTEEGCNCLEITEVRHRSFLSFSYTSVCAHARHIQESKWFHSSPTGTPPRVP